MALAVAVTVADLSGVQHGFWVVLGTLSVLRTSAASTGSTAWRALAGTVIGFAVGAALLAAIGTGPIALWVTLPIAVLVASYAPGTAPFPAGQAAFTVTIVVLFNLLAPAGWRVGLLRIQDVAIGCAVSLVIGLLFWPRGAGPLVGDDLADAFRRGSAYLTQAVDWALGLRDTEPDTAIAAVTAGIRLDDALRGYLAEQGAKRLSKDDLWQLVMSSMRLRLTAHSLAGLRGPAPEDGHPDEARLRLQHRAADLAGFYGGIAAQVGHAGRAGYGGVPGPGRDGAPAADRVLVAGDTAAADGAPVARTAPLQQRAAAGDVAAEENVAIAERLLAADTTVANAIATTGADTIAGPAALYSRPHLLYVHEHLQHLRSRLAAISGPALRLAEVRQQPWWR